MKRKFYGKWKKMCAAVLAAGMLVTSCPVDVFAAVGDAIMDDFSQVSIDESIIKSGYEIDSIVIIEILVALESEFDIEFADGELIRGTFGIVA